MLVELSIIPLGQGTHLSDQLAEIVKVIDASALPYQVTATGTIIEGDWEEVIDLVKRCHDTARRTSPHVFTTLRIEDEEGAIDKLRRNVTVIQTKVGHDAQRMRP